MLQKKVNSLTLYFFENLSKRSEILHFISTRSLNLRAPEDRKLLAEELGFPVENFTLGKQVHGINIAKVKKETCGWQFEATDGLMTNIKDACLMVLVADCVPMLFFDPEKKVIAAAHAGWRGTVHKIAENVIKNLIEEYGSNPKNILVGIGPAIGPCCYEIGLEVVEKAPEEFISKRNNTYYLDLWKANKKQLLDSGIPAINIESAEICTKCHSDVFFSARAERGPTGRFGAGIRLVT